eukprot:Unigene11131_Nuclearia_a/m.34061 Unigene11131_Nuclearia_a/g.34061  ORF Unigene11131_Nuclearia_a/g.34061 Unigene11131_Nuclearia_a/m.34061 type:complete len:438 (+) Unigene11131_Nuclearia_a:141-1454(+)
MNDPGTWVALLEAFARTSPQTRATVRTHFAHTPLDHAGGYLCMFAKQFVADGAMDAQRRQVLSVVGATEDDVATVLAIAMTNNHMFGEDGSALFEHAAMVSHSCSPNLRYASDGTSMKYVCIRPVATGDMLTYSYLPLDMLWRSRRRRVMRLQLSYNFVCDCPRCSAATDPCRPVTCPRCASAALAAPGRLVPDETAWLQRRRAGHPQNALDVGDDDAAASVDGVVWRCTTCEHMAEPRSLPLDREAHYARRAAVLEDQMDSDERTPASPNPLDAAAFAAELRALEAALSPAHHLALVWRKLQAELLLLSTPTEALGFVCTFADYCADVLGEPYIAWAECAPILWKVAESPGTDLARLPMPLLRAAWLFWRASLSAKGTAVFHTLLRRKALAGGCGACGADGRGAVLRVCSACLSVAYCGADCQRADRRRHKPMCTA